MLSSKRHPRAKGLTIFQRWSSRCGAPDDKLSIGGSDQKFQLMCFVQRFGCIAAMVGKPRRVINFAGSHEESETLYDHASIKIDRSRDGFGRCNRDVDVRARGRSAI